MVTKAISEGAEEMARLVKCLLHKQDDQSSNPRAHIKKDRCGGLCLQSQHWGGSGKQISEAYWPASLG